MGIATYSDLKASATDWYMGRSDLAAFADDFITLSEAFLNTVLRCREMEAVVDLTPTDSVCALPDDYLEYTRVVEKVSPRRTLEFITASAADELYPTRPAGVASHFTIIGNSLTALPLSSNDIELTYYQRIPALSEDEPTNWLLTKMPNLYLHACMMHAAEFVKDDDQLIKETGIVQQYIGMLQKLDERGRFAGAGVTLPGVVW